jgi:hypothetical protein
MMQTFYLSLVFCEYFEPKNQTWRAFEVELEIKNQIIPYFPRLIPSEDSHWLLGNDADLSSEPGLLRVF